MGTEGKDIIFLSIEYNVKLHRIQGTYGYGFGLAVKFMPSLQVVPAITLEMMVITVLRNCCRRDQ